jgi:adenosylhomocysteine nucleosidase
MKTEMAFFSQSCVERGFRGEESTTGRLSTIIFPELNLVLAQGGTGKAQFAVQTQYLLDVAINPDLVICAGAAGALVDNLRVGDVVLGVSTVEHDIREGFIDSPLPVFEANPSIIASMTETADSALPYLVQPGIIASGDEDIVTDERREELSKITGAIAVGWEGAGGARACRFSGVDYVEIRGITDGADKDAAQDFEQNLALAMANVAHFLTTWIGHYAA